MSYRITEKPDGTILVERILDDLNLATFSFDAKKLGSETGTLGSKLAQAFHDIADDDVTMLELLGNNLGSKTGAELAQAFACIPDNITMLGLSSTNLGLKTGVELAQALAGIPPGITTLDLTGNHFNPEQLKVIGEWIAKHEGIKQIDGLDDIGIQCALIPGDVTMLDFSGNDFRPEELDVINDWVKSHPKITRVDGVNDSNIQKSLTKNKSLFQISPPVVVGTFLGLRAQGNVENSADEQEVIAGTGYINQAISPRHAHHSHRGR
jgi:hypothetical protein